LKVFATDAQYKHTLAAVRALAAEGVEVHAGSNVRTALCFYSRYTSKRFVYPNPEKREEFVRAIEEIDTREQYDAILPVGNNVWFSLATKGTDSLIRKIPMPPLDSYLIACNKLRTLALAEELGISIPKTIFPADNPRSRLLSIGRPLVVKRAFGSGDARFFYDPDDALAYYERAHYEDNPLLIQEFVRGEGYGFFCLYNRGKLRVFFMHRRIREAPPSGGPSSAAESIYDPKVLALGSRILSFLSWHGVGMVEFRRDSKTGDFKLLEINPKFWGSLDLAIASGVNFPYLAATMVGSGDVPPSKGYKVGLRYCWPIPDDFSHFRARPGSALNVLRDWADPSVKKNIRIDDLGPHFYTIAAHAANWMIFTSHHLKERLSMKPERFGWVVEGKLAASGKPRSLLQLVWLKRQGARAILDLTEGPPLPSRWLKSFGGIYYRVPMEDHIPPPLELLNKAVDFISEQIAHGHVVLVHCLGGLGRTGTVLACYLVKNSQRAPGKAMVEIRSKRPGSIETCQERSVLAYSKILEGPNCAHTE